MAFRTILFFGRLVTPIHPLFRSPPLREILPRFYPLLAGFPVPAIANGVADRQEPKIVSERIAACFSSIILERKRSVASLNLPHRNNPHISPVFFVSLAQFNFRGLILSPSPHLMVTSLPPLHPALCLVVHLHVSQPAAIRNFGLLAHLIFQIALYVLISSAV